MPGSIVLGRENVNLLGNLFPAVVSIVAHLGLTFLTALGGNEDYTIGTAATVDGGRRGVFQDGDVLDVVRWNIADALYGETVNDVKRVVRLGDRTTTTDADLHLCIRRTFSCGDLHTWHLTSQGLRGISNRYGLQCLTVHCGYRTCQVLLLHRTVTDDDDVVQCGGIILERNVNLTLARNVNLFGLHTDVGDDDNMAASLQVDSEITVEIGYTTILGTFFDDTGADERFAGGVHYRNLCLCRDSHCKQCESKGQHKA